MNFELAGINHAIKAGLEFNQTYEMLGGSVTHRMQSGKAIKQTHYNKLRTVLSGRGWIPVGLDGIDYSTPQLLKCALPRVISNTQAQFTIPNARRSDPGFTPKAFALISGYLVDAELNMNADIAMITPVAGAIGYQVHYYPELMVFAEPQQVQGNLSGAEFSWTLTCEEV